MSTKSLMEKVRVLATLDRQVTEDTAFLADRLEKGFFIPVENAIEFNEKRALGQRRIYDELSGELPYPFKKIDEVWYVDERLLAAYYDFAEMRFFRSYEVFWKYMNNQAEKQGRSYRRLDHERQNYDYENSQVHKFIPVDVAFDYISFMQTYRTFTNLCDRNNEEHFLELVTLTAARSIQDFLFARAREAFQYKQLGGLKVECG